MIGRAVHLAVLGINYAPESTGIAPYTTELAAGMAARGHRVQVLTGFPHYPQWRRIDGGEGLRAEEPIDQVTVRRFRHHVPSRASTLGRVVMETTFGLQLLTTRWNRPDVVICVTPPLVAAALSVARARLSSKRPSIGIVVHDLYGHGVVETGTMSGMSASAVRAVESTVLRTADGVAVIHDGFADILANDLSVDRRRIRTIRNWNHVARPDPAASARFRAAHGWDPDDVVVMHAGNMGIKQGLDNVVAAAWLADRQRCRVRFVLLGDGNQRARLEAAGAGIVALQFLPPVSEAEFTSALGAADVLLVNELPGITQMAVPSKLTSYFNSGKPVLAATDADGFTAMEIAGSGAGIRVPGDRPDLLLREALRLGTDRALAARMGEAGRRYCAAYLSADDALDRYEQWILDMERARHRVEA
ncbi:glycosyltransferase family 4 protein [Rhodococcus zopfii]|uniref:glycosyltransferase family 4 protein n=1 Tax=Rhodococcus zopfii TaxID=43772 RepID=UPI0011114F69|nr:glycosyltransferase family 4 protein [Rhodococcus zopfii]